MGTSPQSRPVFRFGVFEVDLRAGELRKSGVKIKLQEQPFQLLVALLERPGEVVTRQELRQKLWPADTFVDFDRSLTTAASRLREGLGDSADNPRFVETLAGRGYRFIGSVSRPPASSQADGERIDQDGLRWKQRLPRALFAVTAIALLAVLFLYFRETPSEAPEAPLRKLTLSAPVESVYFREGLAISPNGKHIAFPEPGERGKLWIQDLDQQQPRAIESTEGALRPFWSPGSDFVGFAASGEELRKVSVQGGPVIRVCQILGSKTYFRGSWSPDGNSIVFTQGSPPALYEVPASGGTSRPLNLPQQSASPEESQSGASHWPHFLPSEAGSRVLVYTFGTASERTMVVQDLETGRREVLGSGSLSFYSPSGHLLYQPSAVTDEIWALPFSLDTLQATGEAFPIAEHARHPTVSADQTLVYLHKPQAKRQLVWLDRVGEKVGEIGPTQEDIRDPALSPDGQLVAYRTTDGGNWDLWVWNFARGVNPRLTTDPAHDVSPVWSPSGKELAFTSTRGSSFDIFLKPADGSGEAKALVATPRNEFLADWSRDGKYLLYGVAETETGADLWYLKRNEGSEWEPQPFLQEPFDQWAACFSPDGRYVAYTSDESGQNEIYVRPFPAGGPKRPVSTKGGLKPRWRRDGKELFYIEGKTLMAVPVSTEPSFSAGKPTRLFEHPSLRNRWDSQYDVSADGQRIVLAEEVGEAPEPSIRVVQNWFAEFRGRQGAPQ